MITTLGKICAVGLMVDLTGRIYCIFIVTLCNFGCSF